MYQHMCGHRNISTENWNIIPTNVERGKTNCENEVNVKDKLPIKQTDRNPSRSNHKPNMVCQCIAVVEKWPWVWKNYSYLTMKMRSRSDVIWQAENYPPRSRYRPNIMNLATVNFEKWPFTQKFTKSPNHENEVKVRWNKQTDKNSPRSN